MRCSHHHTHFLHSEATHIAHPAGKKAQGYHWHILILLTLTHLQQYTHLLCKNIPSCSLSWLKSFPGIPSAAAGLFSCSWNSQVWPKRLSIIKIKIPAKQEIYNIKNNLLTTCSKLTPNYTNLLTQHQKIPVILSKIKRMVQPKFIWVCFFIGTDLEKFSIT